MNGDKSKTGNHDDLDFNPESPDADDPQVDPVKPAKTPAKDKGTSDDYPPYTPDK
ncbi:hypothetical protein ALQ04_03515 [Pseudomonas cichorii]|uniref:Uncharacterized protein n=1 Tax=Pseudomonas cichorii TaxID=36746 RepID=A0A3M4LME7_PSECI|nr:DUF6021 family protein [Pseudomonas cichorii]RMQ42669.1 hypothetical protein ALQ04_03515 [Pseudomonas cichorii]